MYTMFRQQFPKKMIQQYWLFVVSKLNYFVEDALTKRFIFSPPLTFTGGGRSTFNLSPGLLITELLLLIDRPIFSYIF